MAPDNATPRIAPAWLLALTFTTFTFAYDDYVVAGVLPRIADDLAVTEAIAGQLVTVFSLTFALASPVAAVLTASWAKRRLLTGALAMFVLANLVAPLAGDFVQLMALRVLAALAAAVVLPAALGIAATLAPAERQGRYLGLVLAGLTSSIVLGVPIGTWVGAAFDWPATFVLGAALGVMSIIALRLTLPEPPREAAIGLRERLAPLARPAVVVGLLAATLAVLANMMVLTYLSVFLSELAGVGPALLGVVFTLSGLAGIAGGQLGGRASDRWGPATALLIGCGGFAVVMLALAATWPLRPVSLVVILPLLALWSLLAWWIPPPTSARLLALAGPAGPQALALNSSAVYVGVAGGGALGGLVLTGPGSGALPLIAAAVQLVALALFRLSGVTAGSNATVGR